MLFFRCFSCPFFVLFFISKPSFFLLKLLFFCFYILHPCRKGYKTFSLNRLYILFPSQHTFFIMELSYKKHPIYNLLALPTHLVCLLHENIYYIVYVRIIAFFKISNILNSLFNSVPNDRA